MLLDAWLECCGRYCRCCWCYRLSIVVLCRVRFSSHLHSICLLCTCLVPLPFTCCGRSPWKHKHHHHHHQHVPSCHDQFDLGFHMKFSNRGLEAVGLTRRIDDVRRCYHQRMKDWRGRAGPGLWWSLGKAAWGAAFVVRGGACVGEPGPRLKGGRNGRQELARSSDLVLASLLPTPSCSCSCHIPCTAMVYDAAGGTACGPV